MDSVVTLIRGALDTLARASFGALAIAVSLHLMKVAAEARSWHGIVRHAYPTAPLRFPTTYAAFAGAIGVNAILPARVGEALRLGVVRRQLPGSTVATIAGTIVLEMGIEAAFGLAVIGAVLLAGRSIGPFGSPTMLIGVHPIALAMVCAAVLALGAIAWSLRRRIVRLAVAMGHGMSVTRAVGPFLHDVLAWKLIAWMLRFAAVYWFLLAFHLDGSVWIVLLIVAAQNVAGALPLAPGSAGTQQAALALALAGTVSASAVVGFGVGMQVATGLSDIVFGAVAIAATSSWVDIRLALRPARKRPASPSATSGTCRGA